MVHRGLPRIKIIKHHKELLISLFAYVCACDKVHVFTWVLNCHMVYLPHLFWRGCVLEVVAPHTRLPPPCHPMTNWPLWNTYHVGIWCRLVWHCLFFYCLNSAWNKWIAEDWIVQDLQSVLSSVILSYSGVSTITEKMSNHNLCLLIKIGFLHWTTSVIIDVLL